MNKKHDLNEENVREENFNLSTCSCKCNKRWDIDVYKYLNNWISDMNLNNCNWFKDITNYLKITYQNISLNAKINSSDDNIKYIFKIFFNNHMFTA